MIVLGRIVAPFGVQGWVKVHPFGDDPLSWRKMPQWWIGADDQAQQPEAWTPCALIGCKVHGKGLIVAFEGHESRNAAEALCGRYIAAPREALPQPAKDEFYWADLVGLRVLNDKNEFLGLVRGLLETGAHDVLDIVDGDTERLIPFVGVYIQKVDVAKGEIHVEWDASW